MTPRSEGVTRRNLGSHLGFLALLLACGAVVAGWMMLHLGPSQARMAPTVAFAVAFFAARLLTIKLPRGDEVYVTLMVGLCALALLSTSELLIAAGVAAAVDLLARFSRTERPLAAARAFDGIRSLAVLCLLTPAQPFLRQVVLGGGTGDEIIGWSLVVGSVYAFLDLTTAAVQQHITSGAGIVQSISMLLRPLSTVYVVHLAMAAVVLRLQVVSGAWAFPIALLLTLILQNSFNLYLRIRRAYTETIGALAHAAELDRPLDSGHARRVADLSVAVGRRIGLSSHELEQIGYAALLHDIGRIGDYREARSSIQAERGAEIVSSIPFLGEVAPLILAPETTEQADQPIGRIIVRTCSRYDRLRGDLGVYGALQVLLDEETPAEERVLETLEDIVRNKHAAVAVAS